MSTSQVKAQGTVFAYSLPTSPLSFTSIAEVMGGSKSGRSNPMIDSTDMSETSKSYIPAGIVEEGDVSLTLGWRPTETSHAAINAAITNSTQWVVRITYPTSPAIVKQATVYATSLGETIPKEGLLSAEVTFKVVSAWADA